LITILSRSTLRVGFNKNPLSFLFDEKIRHTFDGSHEIARNHKLIEWFTDDEPARPRLYPSAMNFENVRQHSEQPYLCISPASIWYTKQFPEKRWVELINLIRPEYGIYLLGSKADYDLCESIRIKLNKKAKNLCGKIKLLDTAALMKHAALNLVNDSAPMHLASAMNAPVCVIYCSTIPSFGYGPLSDDAQIVEVGEPLDCRPCGIHGLKSCPEGHFDCAWKIDLRSVLKNIHLRLEKY
jgi:ADP-heptose:LPS heptosyltransferase